MEMIWNDIQKQLLLLLIFSRTIFLSFPFSHSKTTFVTVNLIVGLQNILSRIIQKQLLLLLILTLNLPKALVDNSKTTFVTVNQRKNRYRFIKFRIQKQLLLLLIIITLVKTQVVWRIQKQLLLLLIIILSSIFL